MTLYIFLIFMSSIIALSASNFFTMWVAMEISVFALIPLFTKYKSASTNESMLKYFLVQISAGLLFLGSILFFRSFEILIFIALMMKLGLFPFYLWVPHIYSGVSYFAIFVLSTFQKIAPLIAVSNTMNNFSLVIGVLSIFIGAISGIFITNIKKIMAFSSISHSGWMLLLTEFFGAWSLYFFIYSLLLIFTLYYFSVLNFKSSTQTLKFSNFSTFSVWLLLSSLAGLPPFLGFYLKWLTLSLLTPYLGSMIYILVLTFSLSLFFYLNIFILSTLSLYNPFKKQISLISVLTTFLNLFGIFFVLYLY